MQNTPFDAPEQEAISPFDPSRDHSAQLTRRMYNLIMGGLVTAGFAVIAACALLAQAPAFLYAVVNNYLAISIGSFIASIAGIAVMHMGMKREGYGVTLAGYALLACSIGFTTGMVLPFYSLPSIPQRLCGHLHHLGAIHPVGNELPYVLRPHPGHRRNRADRPRRRRDRREHHGLCDGMV